jgi:hypothetical protein
VKDHTPTIDRRFPGSEAAIARTDWTDEETLVADSRAALSPSQIVEQKLIRMLKDSPVLVSHIQQRLKPGPH